jgi:hypothetical protein
MKSKVSSEEQTGEIDHTNTGGDRQERSRDQANQDFRYGPGKPLIIKSN